MSLIFRLFLVLLPWTLKRNALRRLYGYELHRQSHIGLAWVFPERLLMRAGARIDHLTVCKGLQLLSMGERSSIGRLNWISAHPLDRPPHFAHIAGRKPQLLIEEHAAITNRHLIDCTEQVRIGRYATVAGFRSQILTHSIDLQAGRQDAKPIDIGEYTFVGTACTLLGGARVPHHSVVGACALVNKPLAEPYTLYAGVPATAVSPLDPAMRYFSRTEGFVH